MGIELIFFDMDGTLVDCAPPFGSTWDELGKAAGVGDKFEANIHKYYPLKKDYETWVEADVSLLKGRDFETLKNLVLPPPYAPGVKEFFEQIEGKYILGLITGGVDFMADYIVEDLGLDFYVANKIGVSNGVFDGTYNILIDLWKQPDKTYYVKEFMRRYNLPKEKTMYIGDNENDIAAALETGIFIARNPKTEKTKQSAHYIVDNFLEILPILKKNS